MGMKEFREGLRKGDQKLHPVETQWHYKILTEYGFVCNDPPQKGFVRSYTYRHPVTGRTITTTTGCHSDYWEDAVSGYGYWSTLEDHLKSIQP